LVLTPLPHQRSLLLPPSTGVRLVTQSYTPDWSPIFGSGFGLRCFQPLSTTAQLPGVYPAG